MSKFDLSRIHGILVPIITPVDQDENIDLKKLRWITRHVIDNGIDGILAFGSNSEFYMFTDDEMIEATKTILDEAAGAVPVYFGIGHIRTKQAVALAKRASQLPIEAISVLQPMFIQPTETALYHHFKTIAESVPDTKMLLYSNPGRTGYTMSDDLIVKLAHDVENIVGIKESSGNVTKLEELVRRTQDIDFQAFAGKDTIVFPGLCVGAVGAVCSTANMYTELVCGIYDKFQAGDYAGARANQFKLNPIRNSQDAASFPAATKDMANLMGMDVGPSVLPTEATTGPVLEKMKQAMREAGYLK
ncbi:dihydrodipicolinate synthase family protein [Lacticaseibacillus jixiensis]|uniref:dihydrodipicolinate synthase family protein n=1 Tax=Lacticaseibacillus jixiensis TaxID=3231926 RepID=UPI0036F3AC39